MEAEKLEPITVGEAAILFEQMTDEIFNEAGVYDKALDGGESSKTPNGGAGVSDKKNVVINTPGVTLKNKVINGNLILSEGIGDGDVSLDHVTVSGTVYVRGGGLHTVHVSNSNIPSAVVERKDGPVHIACDKNSSLGELAVLSETVVEGDFSTVRTATEKPVMLAGNIREILVDNKSNLALAGGAAGALTVSTQVQLRNVNR